MRLVTLGMPPLALAAMLGDPRAPVAWWDRQPLRIIHVVTSHDRIDALALLPSVPIGTFGSRS